MCDCVTSPQMSLTGIRCQDFGSHRCYLKLRTCRTVNPRRTDFGRNHGETSNSSVSDRSRFGIGEFRIIRGNMLHNAGEGERLKSKCCINVRLESYGLFDELGFKDKRDKGLKVETHGGDGEVDGGFSSSVREAGIETIKASESKRFDVLEFKTDLDDEKRGSAADSNQAKCLSDVDSTAEDVGPFLGRFDVRNGRQVVRRSNMLAKQVISMQSALSLGFISQLWVDTSSWMVVAVELRPNMLSGEMERFLLEDVCKVGDVVLIQDESVLENDFKMFDLDTLVGYSVATPSRHSIGKVRGYTFDINSGAVELLELDSFGVSIIPSSLVSTYALLVEDVIGVEADTVIVQEVAASRVQKLTKGFWDAPAIGAINNKVEGFSDLERLPRGRHGRRQRQRQQQQQQQQRRQKFTSRVMNADDDWQLPMDYL